MSLLQPEQSSTSTLERIKSGIPGLDSRIQGGIPKGSITLVSGPPGGGKTIFCFQYLYEGCKAGQKCLFLTLDKKVEGLLSQAKEIGLEFEPYIQQGTIVFKYLNINKKLVYETMVNEILQGNYDRIVLDSVSPLSEMPIYINNLDIAKDIDFIEPDQFKAGDQYPVRRLHLHYIMNALETSEATSIVTSELPSGSHQLSRDGLSEFLADAVIVMSIDPTMDRRKLSILKMRSTKHTLKPQDIQIEHGGIQIL